MTKKREDGQIKIEKQSGYSLEEYEEISRKSKPALPLRCPITLECTRAKGTRHLFTVEMKGTVMSVEYEVTRDEGYTLNPHLTRIFQNSYPKEFLTKIYNACPEVIYEYYGLFAESYDKYEDYDMGGQIKFKRFETEGKHYSQCHEFANWLIKKNLDDGPAQKHRKRFAEKEIEDYLVNNLGILEKGLSIRDRQVRLSTGRADILAVDSSGNEVFIELKAKPMTPGDVHKLCGQVSTYFNTINTDGNARFIIVVPKDGSDHNYKIWHGLKHWISKVKILQFETVSNGDYSFSVVEYLQ